MTDQEKLDLARWLAERLEPEPEWKRAQANGPSKLQSKRGFWFIFHVRSPRPEVDPAPLDGNFADNVIHEMQKQHSYDVRLEPWWIDGEDNSGGELQHGYRAEFAQEDEGPVAYHKDWKIAVCLAAEAALEGGGE